MSKKWHGTVYGKLKYLQGAEISIAVYKLKRFYALADISTIWDELQVYISPRYRMEQFCDLCFRFLPVHMTGQEQRAYGAGLWWTTLWRLYEMVENGSLWGDQLPSLFSSMWRFAPDFLDLSPLYEDIFTRVLRAMGLSMRKGRIVAGDTSGSSSLSNMALWIGDLLGGPKSAQPQLTRLMKCMEVYLHPSNNGEHTIYILEFMRDLAERIRERIYHERVKTHKRKVPVDYYLQVEMDSCPLALGLMN